jgi:Tfp pilus assembly protein PilF
LASFTFVLWVFSCSAATRCTSHLSIGKVATAIKYFSKAIQANPRYEPALLARAEAYLKLHDLSNSEEGTTSMVLLARKDYLRLVHLQPDNNSYR